MRLRSQARSESAIVAQRCGAIALLAAAAVVAAAAAAALLLVAVVVVVRARMPVGEMARHARYILCALV